jgi:ubiquinone/menaquinone biosynthesis C-methylase UbiE
VAEYHSDLDRMRAEYGDRARRLVGSDLYSLFNVANLFIVQQRARAILSLLRRHGFQALSERRTLEVGCGEGAVLLEFLSYGAVANRLHGTDLLPDRVRNGHARLPHVPLTCSDGQQLPYADGAFDLVLQFTALSSILDPAVKAAVAQEMVRVMKKPGGMILWYDFWFNAVNSQVRGIRPAEVQRLFADCRCEFHRVTLAPPITRLLAKSSWLLCCALERLRVFNSHYLVAIRARSGL